MRIPVALAVSRAWSYNLHISLVLIMGALAMPPTTLGGQIRDPYADALRYFELGRYERANKILQDVLLIEPECVECYDLLARISTTQQQDSLAASWYRKALEVEPHNAILYQKLGYAEHRSGELDQAIMDLERSLELHTASAETHFALGNVWYDMEMYNQAKDSYLQALAFDSTTARYHFQLGMVYFNQEIPDTALMAFKNAYRWYPKYSLAYEFAANILISQHKWSDAVEVLEQGLASAPETNVTRYWLGRAHVEERNFKRAAELLRGYVKRYGDHIGARYNFGLALFEIGEHEEAVTQLCSVTVHLPDLLKARLFLGRSLSALDQDSSAFAEFDTLLTKDPSYYGAWISRGDLDLKRDRYMLATMQYERAARIDPDQWEAYHRQALAHYLQGEYTEAELLLLEALIRQDSAVVVYELLGDVASAMREDDFSVYYYAMVLRFEPEKISARTKLINAFIRRQLWRAARDHLLWRYEKQPDNEKILYQLTRVSYADGDTSAAELYKDQYLQRHTQRREREILALRIRLDHLNPARYRDMGRYYLDLGDNSSARAYFRRAVALGDKTLPASLYLDEGERP
jgi:tetratricopeptide (TPR) repeat protein